MQLLDNMISFGILNYYTKGGTKYNFGLRPSDFSKCKFIINQPSSNNGYRIVDSNRNVCYSFFFFFFFVKTKIVFFLIQPIDSIDPFPREEQKNLTCSPVSVDEAIKTISILTSNLTRIRILNNTFFFFSN